MRLRRLPTISTAVALALPLVHAAHAQTDDQSAVAAPPARVGQIAMLRGSVSFDSQTINGQGASAEGTGGWTAAQLNYPVSTGDTLYTQPDAEAAIAVNWSRITLAGGTEFAVTALDDRTLQATEAQGETYLDVRYLPRGSQFVITTPRGTVTIDRNGRYDIIAGDQTAPTQVTVVSGSATVNGQNVALSVGPGETAALSGDNPVTASLGGARRDRFMERMARFRQTAPPSYVPPSVSQMTGADELSQYGSWSRAPNYGAVWYPRVAPGWVPYRSGHWDYVRPWGWTWVASEPWGFAPSHYGRWVDTGNRWGWAPAPVESQGYDDGPSGYSSPSYEQQPNYDQPVYAPALVTFFSVGSPGLALAVGAGALAAGSIGWIPLAPNEPYYPPYRCPPRYIRRINVSNVRDIANITRINNVSNTTIINNDSHDHAPERLINRTAATVVAATAMQRGTAVAAVAHPAPQAILAAARPIAPAALHPRPVAAGGPGGHPLPALAHLPGAPQPLARRAPAPAPRPAVFAAARGLPVAHPAPIRPAAARILGVPGPRAVNKPLAHPPVPASPGAISHPPAMHAPVATNPAPPHPPLVRPPAAPLVRPPMQPQPHVAAPGFQNQVRHLPPPPQAPHAPVPPRPVQPVQVPARPPMPVYHPPAQQPLYHPPVYHPPVQQQRPVVHPPVQPPVYHPPVQQPRPVFHPPVQPPVYHPPVQQPRPVFHPPVQPPVFHPPAQPPRPVPGNPSDKRP